MELLYILLTLLVVTKLFGEIAVRVGQPALVGELLSGIAVGIVASSFSESLPVLSELTENEVFIALTELGVFFLMLHAGLDMKPKDIMEASGESLLVAICAMGLPLVCGLGAGWVFLPDSEFKLAQALFIGVALAITAVPVAVKVLMDLGILHTRAGQLVVSAAVFDDILSLLLLAILTAVIRTGALPDAVGIGILVGKIALFFGITILFGRFLFPLAGRLLKRLKSDELELSFLLIAAFGYGLLAETLGMHFIMGAFVAGLFFVRRTIDEKTYTSVTTKVSGITSGFLAPIFFASIGLHLDLNALTAVPLFVATLVCIAFVSKLLGASIPAYFLGISPKQSVAIGVAMSARGAVELIVADVALRGGLFDKPQPSPIIVENMFSTIVIVAVATTLVVPITLPFFAKSMRSENGETRQSSSRDSDSKDHSTAVGNTSEQM
jgi:Kef-type K+ transport system membrane component KefB